MSKFNSKNKFAYFNENHDNGNHSSVEMKHEKHQEKDIIHPSIFPHVNARELAVHLNFTSSTGAGLLRQDGNFTRFDDTFPAALPQYARTIQVVHILVTFGRSYHESVPQKIDQGKAIEALAAELKHFPELKELEVSSSCQIRP
jgi:hypothetical protein